MTATTPPAQASDEPMRAAVESECRKSCNICFDENGNEWPCTKELAKKLAATKGAKL